MPNQASTAEAAFVGQQSAAGGRVRILRIDRPAARNALNAAILTALAARFRRADADDEVRAIVLTGGEEVFSAGADIDALSGHSPSSYLKSPNRAAFDAIRDTRKPVVAAVAGYCLGGGCEIALGCDFVVAADNAVFGQPEINLGIIPGAGGTQLWERRASAGLQAIAALRGATVDAFAARQHGLADAVVPAGAVVAAGVALAAELSEKAPLAMRAAKAAMRAVWSAPLHGSLRHETALMAGLLGTQDAREGVAAFLDKRPPRFEGR